VKRAVIEVVRVLLELGARVNEKDLNSKTAVGFAKDCVEIETVLWGHPGVEEAVVIVREDHPREKRLVVYYVGMEMPEALRGYLQAKLPGHMLPAVFMQLAALPLKPNGKVIRQLCACIAAVDSDPTEAMSLYLILFHALSVWELRHVRIPVPVRPLRQGTSVPSLSESYYLIVPKPSPSLGDRSPGRPDVRLDFHPSAASWPRNLLDRYEHQRRQIVQNPANEYLFVSSMSARRDMPVGKAFFWHAIRRASLRVLGGAYSPNILRKTVGIMFADRAGAGILHWMGWDDQQAFAYTWAERQIVRPRQELSSNLPGSYPSAEPVVFPSPLNHAS
jgi:AMP-binding enzyme